jgi:hypothetical protein
MVRWIACLLVAGLLACGGGEPAGEEEHSVGAGGPAEQAVPAEIGPEQPPGAREVPEAEQEAGEAVEEEEAEDAPPSEGGAEPMP